MKEKVGSEFFRAKKVYYCLYDTYALFGDDARALRDGAEGPPPRTRGHRPRDNMNERSRHVYLLGRKKDSN